MIKSRKVKNKKIKGQYQENKINQKKKRTTQRKLICFSSRKRTRLNFSHLLNNKRIIIYRNGYLYKRIYISNIKNQYNKEKVIMNLNNMVIKGL